MDAGGLDEVLRRARRHDPAALETLVERYGSRVFGLLYRLTGSRDAADELMQETFLRVVRTIGRYEESGKFEAWLFRIAANLARDRARRLGRRGALTPLDGASTDGEPVGVDFSAGHDDEPDARLLRREAAQRLETSLAGLSEAEREIISLRHYSGLSFREIADLLQVPLGTALARAHRALARLRRAMSEE